MNISEKNFAQIVALMYVIICVKSLEIVPKLFEPPDAEFVYQTNTAVLKRAYRAILFPIIMCQKCIKTG